MGSAPGTGSLADLKDSELVGLLPASKGDKYDDDYHRLSTQERKQLKSKREAYIREEYRKVLDILWLRHEPNMRRVLKSKVFAPGSTLCPPQEPSKDDFVGGVLTMAYQAFLARTFRGKYENFPGYVWTLVLRIALDERKRLKGRYDEVDGDDEDRESRRSEVGKPDTPNKEIEPQKPILVPQPKGMPDPVGAKLDLTALDVKKILDEYAEENPASARALCWKWIEQWTWDELVDELLPAEVDGRGVDARMANAHRFLKKDEDRVLPRLAPYRKRRGNDVK